MKSGIYKIVNLINNKFYIGSAVNLKARKSQHWYLLKNNKHHSKHLQNSVNKNKLVNFKFEVIELCNKEDLVSREQYYLDKLNPKYNILKVANSLLGYKMSESSKNKMRESFKKVPKEIKDKITLARLKAIQKPFYQLDKVGNIIKEWDSLQQFSKETGLRGGNVSSVLTGNRKSAFGYKFKYKKNG